MDEIDEQTVPPLRKEDGDFQPYLPQKEGEEGFLTKLGLKKKLLKAGQGWDWETPDIGDEITVNCTGTALDGEQFFSSKEKGEPLVFRIGHGMHRGQTASHLLSSTNGALKPRNLQIKTSNLWDAFEYRSPTTKELPFSLKHNKNFFLFFFLTGNQMGSIYGFHS